MKNERTQIQNVVKQSRTELVYIRKFGWEKRKEKRKSFSSKINYVKSKRKKQKEKEEGNKKNKI